MFQIQSLMLKCSRGCPKWIFSRNYEDKCLIVKFWLVSDRERLKTTVPIKVTGLTMTKRYTIQKCLPYLWEWELKWGMKDDRRRERETERCMLRLHAHYKEISKPVLILNHFYTCSSTQGYLMQRLSINFSAHSTTPQRLHHTSKTKKTKTFHILNTFLLHRE